MRCILMQQDDKTRFSAIADRKYVKCVEGFINTKQMIKVVLTTYNVKIRLFENSD